MFSSTTMASSITRPMAIVRPASEMMLSVRPSAQAASRPNTTEVGMDTAATNVARPERRKAKITSTAKSAPRRPSMSRPRIDSRTPEAFSVMVVTLLAPISRRVPSRTSSTRSTISTSLARSERKIDRETDGLPFVRAKVSPESARRRTAATSPSVRPSASWTRRSSAAVSDSEPSTTSGVRAPSLVTAPAGREARASRICCATAAGVRPPAIARRVRVTSNRGRATPARSTRSTPSSASMRSSRSSARRESAATSPSVERDTFMMAASEKPAPPSSTSSASEGSATSSMAARKSSRTSSTSVP